MAVLHKPLERTSRARKALLGRVPPWVYRVLAIYMASRLVVLLGVLVAGTFAPPLRAADWALRWDSFWYLHIAQNGYPRDLGPLSSERLYNAHAFFPLWPLLIRGVSVL